MGSRRFVLVAVVAGVVAAASATAASDLRLSLVGSPAQPEARTPVSIVVRATRGRKPVQTKVGVWIAKGRVRRLFAARAEANGRYRARVVFPSAGRWTFGAQAGRTRVTFGSVRARRPAVPLTFSWPTSIDVESSRSVLLVENGAGRVIRVDPVSGKTTRITSIDRAYAVAHAAGVVYLSAGQQLVRLDGGSQTVVTQGDEEIGPIAVGLNGDVYYATRTRVFRVPGGTGAPTPIADGVAAPHGLAVTADGSLLVCDTGNGLVKRIDLATGLSETWVQLGEPRGIDISADGTVYIVDASVRRVVHLMADGRRLGFVGPRFHDPYDVEVAGGGTVYVLDTAAAARLYRVAPDGKTTVVARR